MKKGKPLGVPVGSEADRHSFLTCGRLSAISAEKTIPPRQVETKIAIELLDQYGVVHPVHLRCHYEKPEDAVYGQRETDVPVVEHAGGIEKYFKQDDRDGGSSKEDDRSHLDTHGKDNLNGMETDSCCDIKVEVRVMYPMETPKGRNEMEHGMLNVNDEIEGQDADDHSHPGRQRKVMEYSPTAFFDKQGYPHGRER